MDGRAICPHCGKAVYAYRTVTEQDRMAVYALERIIGLPVVGPATGPEYFMPHNCAGDHKPVKGAEGEKG